MVRASGGTLYVALRPLLADYTLAMTAAPPSSTRRTPRRSSPRRHLPRRAGARGRAGSGALSCWLLRAMGRTGPLVSYERRADFAAIAEANVEGYFGGPHKAWHLMIADLPAMTSGARARHRPRVPGLPRPSRRRLGTSTGWCLTCWRRGSTSAPRRGVLIAGGVICCYVATVTQLSRDRRGGRGHGGFDEPAAWESLTRGWHVDGLAVRPGHRMIAPYRLPG